MFYNNSLCDVYKRCATGRGAFTGASVPRAAGRVRLRGAAVQHLLFIIIIIDIIVIIIIIMIIISSSSRW